jgi:hypothetical protein
MSKGSPPLLDLMPAILPLFAPLEFTSTDNACFFESVHSTEASRMGWILALKPSIFPAIAIPLRAAPSIRDI